MRKKKPPHICVEIGCLHDLFSRLSQSLGQLFGKLQNIAMGRGTVLDYVRPEAQAVVDDLNELDNEEYEL